MPHHRWAICAGVRRRPLRLGPEFRDGRQHPVPYLTGATSWESSLLARLDDSIADMLLAAFQISRDVLLNFSSDGVEAKTDFEKKRVTFFEALYDSGGM